MQPVNYGVNLPNPLESFTQGFGVGDALRQRTLAEHAAAAQAQRQMEINQMLTRLTSKDATAEDWVGAANILPPEQAESLRKNFAMLEGEKQKALLSRAVPVFSALASQKPEEAINALEAQAQAFENSGDAAGARYNRTLIETIKINPTLAFTDYAAKIALMPGGKEIIQNVYDSRKMLAESELYQKSAMEALRKQAVDNNLTEAQTAKLLAETKKLGLDAGLLAQEIADKKSGITPPEPLSAIGEKLVNDAITQASEASLLTAQYENIANQIDKEVSGGGTPESIRRNLEKIWGGASQQSALRDQYDRLKSLQVLKMLPPGAASDKDIEIAMRAFPDSNASPEAISKFMRAMVRVQKAEIMLNEARAEWVTKNGHLGNASSEFTVNGVLVKPGQKFSDIQNGKISFPEIENILGRQSNQPNAPAQRVSTPPANVPGTESTGGFRVPGVTPGQTSTGNRVERRNY